MCFAASSTKVALTARALRLAMEILRGVPVRGRESDERRAEHAGQQ